MYRILAQEDKVRKRRNPVRRLDDQKSESLINRPNQHWSWNIIKLIGPNKGTSFYLYVVLDNFSRCVVGWRIAPRESGSIAGKLIQETCHEQRITRNQLTLHSDRDSSTTCNVMLLLSNLKVPQMHSQPHTSNNRISSSQLKVLKDQPLFPAYFGCIEDAQVLCQAFFNWYNKKYHHSSNRLLTPEVVHYGSGKRIVEQQQQLALSSAYRAHPERFVHHPPQLPRKAKNIA